MIFWRMLLTKQVVTENLTSNKLWKSMTTINSLVTNVLKNIHFLTTVAVAFCGMEEEKKTTEVDGYCQLFGYQHISSFVFN